MDKYFEQCKELSLTARMAVALIVFERYCKQNKINSPLTREFSEYLWKWPLIDGPDQFEPWEKSRTELVNIGLGASINSEIKSQLIQAGIDEDTFIDIVSGVVEILWSSFWGATENELSHQTLCNVIRDSKIEELPPLTPFKFSRYSEGNGWGVKISLEDCEYWKGRIKLSKIQTQQTS